MKFKTKIKISFAIIAICPIVIMLLLFISVFMLQVKRVEWQYDIDDVGIDAIVNQTKFYNKLTNEFYDELMRVAGNEPDRFKDTDYLKKVNQKLQDRHSFILVEINSQMQFDGSSKENKEFLETLPSYRGENEHIVYYDGNSYIYGDYKYLIKEIGFELSDNKSGCVYIVTAMEKVILQVREMVLEMFISIIIVVILTCIVLGIWIQRSVMRPVTRLTDATKKIAEGDLDFVLERTSKDEFGDLCEDFEYMRKRLKESAEENIRNEEESKELISNISHDLKTPITAIKGYVEGIMDGVADTPEKKDKYIRTIYNKANDMDKLIGELTLYSKIDTNRIPYNFNKVNVDEYFSDCVEEIVVELEAKNITLNYFNYVDKDTLIIADPEQLKRVINNIISNSVKYIGNKKGAVNIRVNDEADFIHVEIEDNGKGISQKDLPYIFDRFYRTDISRNSNQGGSGIGLAIVKKIIEVHGGRIWANSKENTGTIMHFILRKYYEPEVNADYEQNIDN
ncbi:MAG: HAMP domain-containing histidine kinase [Lachnospiraceae bacterium]|nr:HAMP domain-containing histidine kinase [Lachnospiraceae bacterium]